MYSKVFFAIGNQYAEKTVCVTVSRYSNCIYSIHSCIGLEAGHGGGGAQLYFEILTLSTVLFHILISFSRIKVPKLLNNKEGGGGNC